MSQESISPPRPDVPQAELLGEPANPRESLDRHLQAEVEKDVPGAILVGFIAVLDVMLPGEDADEDRVLWNVRSAKMPPWIASGMIDTACGRIAAEMENLEEGDE